MGARWDRLYFAKYNGGIFYIIYIAVYNSSLYVVYVLNVANNGARFVGDSYIIGRNRVGGILGAFSRDFGCSFFLPTLYIVSIMLMCTICSVNRVGGYFGQIWGVLCILWWLRG